MLRGVKFFAAPRLAPWANSGANGTYKRGLQHPEKGLSRLSTACRLSSAFEIISTGAKGLRRIQHANLKRQRAAGKNEAA